nr:hypothetical protein [Methylobacterium sp. L1A1]
MASKETIYVFVALASIVSGNKAEASACDQQTKCFNICEEFSAKDSPECKSACSPAIEICENEKKQTANKKKPTDNNPPRGLEKPAQITLETKDVKNSSASECAQVQYAPSGFMTYCPDVKRKFSRLNDSNEPCFLSNIVGFTRDTITFCTPRQFAIILKGEPYKSSGYYQRVVRRGPYPASY